MNFKTEKEILLNAIAYAQEQNLISEAEDIVERIANGEQTENQYVLDLATHAYINADSNQQIEYIYEGTDIATARGNQLDQLGNLLNVHRLPGLPAQLSITLSLSLPETADIEIPAGTVVIIDQLQIDPYITYTTDAKVVMHAGTTSATVTASSDYHALQRRVPKECVQGLEGFPLIITTNQEAGTTGRDIENDDDYRQRILLWNVKNQRGTKSSFDAYLGQVEGLDDYKLIPQPEGVGTLTVVCDCNESILPTIQQGIQDNCMIYTDDPVQTINPGKEFIDITVTATITREPIQHTVSEIIELIRHEVETWITGGNTRTATTITGLRIGEDFIPSQLVMHLHNQFPELLSIEVTSESSQIDDIHKWQSREVEVVIT